MQSWGRVPVPPSKYTHNNIFFLQNQNPQQMELSFLILEKTTWGHIKGTREAHQDITWGQIKGM